MRNRENARGFALPDALIAAAIAAAVAVAVAHGLGVAARSARSAEEFEAVVADAETIAARLRARMPADEVLREFSNWRIEASPYEMRAAEGGEVIVDGVRLRAVHDGPPSFQFETILVGYAPEDDVP